MDITVEELKERLEKGEDLHFYDVREEHEYEEDNLGAILIPLGELPDHLDELEPLKDEEIIIHCRSGARSGKAARYLESQGFSNVRNVLGGILAYRELED
ncbi:rhodanese-related sulfurtransferase [Dyadobacter sp. BE34]|jgi:rhodanese-related sulfurtransferase|uniref:Rhodanese-related sulfurtransferase n=1 Tax=Dyadobacter fermentans TaxID=94254 RepID=A0ABU1R3Y1_9BACT|nr:MULTISPECIES: rhodanese-like domain-containing protein [Dyadobacter]HWV32002.1 rhodanese-like domain-containing protein [Dyadobacter sp.]MBZ1357094.1 rhodanese-like domain-containing protein [Dyadobacter fermentans]MDR6808080.1 rhodanese-related sulfurtransferase [Dyadobacter fermentans]MDR7046104.1 rhodanese-related sulfurtransferase [Dyadobacter sp. BE242]MDR7200417.1 rhodanese-related sulfurtransferase [Dyadobacter sp. BE34]